MQYDANQGLELQQLLHATTNIELPFPLSAEKEKLAPKSIVPKKIKFDEDRFFTILSPLEVARQMTLLDESITLLSFYSFFFFSIFLVSIFL